MLFQRSGVFFLLLLKTTPLSDRAILHQELMTLAEQTDTNYQRLLKISQIDRDKNIPADQRKLIEEYITNLKIFISKPTDQLPHFISNPNVAFIRKSLEEGALIPQLNAWVDSFEKKGEKDVTDFHNWIYWLLVLDFVLLVVITGFIFYPMSRYIQAQFNALKKSEEEFRKNFELSGVGKIQADPLTAQILRVNHKLCEMSGYSSEELLAKTIWEISHPQDRDEYKKEWDKLLRNEIQEFSIETRLLRKEEGFVWVNVNATMLRDLDGAPLRISAIIQDIDKRKKTEDALHTNEERFRALVEQVKDYAIFSTNPNGIITTWNEGARRVLGYNEDEFIGHSLAMLFTPEDIKMGIPEKEMNEAMEFGSADDDRWMLKKNGIRFFASGITNSILDKSGELIGFTKIMRDLTFQKRTEEAMRESQQRLHQAIAIETVGIVFLKMDGSIIEANDAFLRMSGYTREEWKQGMIRWEALTPSEWVPQSVRAQEELKVTGRATPYEKEFIRKDGSRWWALFAAKQISTDEAVEFIIDMTETKEAQERVKHYADELLRSNRDLEHFAYIASHDLKEPLHLVSNFTDLLRKRYETKLDEKGRQYIEHIIESTKKMQGLINDLLSYSKVGRENKFQDIDLNDICVEAKKNLALLIEETGAHIKCEPLPHLIGDPSLLIQLFQNLISNAIKFRKPKQKPEVQIFSKEEGKNWFLYIKDNGIGIKPEYFTQIFEIFGRLHGEKEYPGSGIGLALCKKIVEFHEGKIWVESELNEGSTFFMMFPKIRRTIQS
jgi:PAS domain S-box-containing protein